MSVGVLTPSALTDYDQRFFRKQRNEIINPLGHLVFLLMWVISPTPGLHPNGITQHKNSRANINAKSGTQIHGLSVPEVKIPALNSAVTFKHEINTGKVERLTYQKCFLRTSRWLLLHCTRFPITTASPTPNVRKVLSRNLPGETDKTHEKPQSRYLLLGRDLNAGPPEHETRLPTTRPRSSFGKII